MPSLSCVPVPEVLPAVMPQFPVVPEFLPAPPPELVLPEQLPAGLPAPGRAALAGELPGRKRPDLGEPVREAGPCRQDDAEITRLRGFLRTVTGLRPRQGRGYPLDYLLALPLAAGMAGDDDLPCPRAGLWPGRIRPGPVRVDGRPRLEPAVGHAEAPADRRQGGQGRGPRGGRAPMLLSGLWDDGTTGAQLVVDVGRPTRFPSRRSCRSRSPPKSSRARS